MLKLIPDQLYSIKRAILYMSVESTHNKFVGKISRSKKFIWELTKYTEFNSGMMIGRIKEIKKNYSLGVAEIMYRFYAKPCKEYGVIYSNILSSNNFSGQLDEILWSLKFVIDRIDKCADDVAVKKPPIKAVRANAKPPRVKQNTKLEKLKDKLHRELLDIMEENIECVLEYTNSDYCVCGGKVELHEQGDIKCPKCGSLGWEHNLAYCENPQVSETNSTRKGSFDYIRHLNLWLDCIQAKKNKNFSDDELGRLRECCRRDDISDAELDCETIREYLVECDMTSYNNHAPLIIKKLTDGRVQPPQLTEKERNDVRVKFIRIMELFEMVKIPGEDLNRSYYPYFIYKIFEEYFKDNSEKLKLLDCIHLQSRETVIKNDNKYREICDISLPEDNLTYRCTDYSKRLLKLVR
jgi:hypothetical protein